MPGRLKGVMGAGVFYIYNLEGGALQDRER